VSESNREFKTIVRRYSVDVIEQKTAQRCSAVGESDRERGAEIAKLCRGQKPARETMQRDCQRKLCHEQSNRECKTIVKDILST
jgi:hypothetical protein